MRSTLIRSVLLFLCIFCSTLGGAVYAVEITDFQFTEVGQLVGREGLPDDALSDTTIFDIAEDSKGYIWVATMSGLNRYSGYDTKHYFESDTNPNSVPSGLIRALHVDESGTLWVGTLSGIAKYRPESDDFEVFDSDNSLIRSSDIVEISDAVDGDIIFADSKNFVYRRNKASGKIQLLDENIRVPQRIRVALDEVNRTWLGTSGEGAFIYDKQEERLYSLSKVNPWGISLPVKSVFDIEVINGEYWLATDNGIKVVSMDGRVSNDVHKNNFLEHEPIKVISLEQHRSSVWAGTDKGLFVLQLADSDSGPKIQEVTHVNSEYGDITGLTQEFIPSIFKDSTGGLWLGTYQGLFRYHPERRSQKLISNLDDFQGTQKGATVWSLSTDQYGMAWLATQSHGLGRYDATTGRIDYFLTELANSGISFWDLDIDKYGVFWISSSSGLLAFEFTGERLKKITSIFDGNFIDRQYFDGNYLWLWLDDKGLVSVQTNMLQQYVDGSSDNFIKYYPELSTSLLDNSENNVNSVPLPIFRDDTNRLWLSSDSGITLFNPQRKKVVQRIGSENGLLSRAISVYQTDENFWVTTRSDGVYKINKRSLKVVKKQSRSQGGFIFSSVGYENFIWYADNQGISVVDLSTLQVIEKLNKANLNYNFLNEGAVTITPQNTILFGGSRGFNSVLIKTQDGSALDENEQTRKPQLFEFTIFGQSTKNHEVEQSHQTKSDETRVSNII